MRMAQIDGQAVVNVIEAEPGYEIPGFLLVETQEAGPGWKYIGGQFFPPSSSPTPIPQIVTRAQGKAALIQAGKWNTVLAYVASIKSPSERALAEVALNDTVEWRRDSPFLNAAANAIGLTDAQMDDLFRTAATIAL